MTSDPSTKLDYVPSHVLPESVVEFNFNHTEGADIEVHLAWKKLQAGSEVKWTTATGAVNGVVDLPLE